MLDHLSYLAGIFDGEGCISANGPSKQGNWKLEISVAMTHEATVRAFQAQWGGSVYTRAPRKSTHARQWAWQVRGTRAIPFLEWAAPHLRIKQRQAEIGLAIARDMVAYSGSRKGIPLSQRQAFFTASRKEWRAARILEMRGLNHSRPRFEPKIYPDRQARLWGTP